MARHIDITMNRTAERCSVRGAKCQVVTRRLSPSGSIATALGARHCHHLTCAHVPIWQARDAPAILPTAPEKAHAPRPCATDALDRWVPIRHAPDGGFRVAVLHVSLALRARSLSQDREPVATPITRETGEATCKPLGGTNGAHHGLPASDSGTTVCAPYSASATGFAGSAWFNRHALPASMINGP